MYGYNVSVQQFENGETIVSYYRKGVNVMNASEKSFMKDVRSKRDSDIPALDSTEHFVNNPFTGEYELLTDVDALEYVRQKKEHSLQSSYARTKKNIYDYARCVKWEYFITLTYDSKKVDRYDFDACMKKARQWFNNQQKRYSSFLKYLIVPEQHKDGAWHVHGLVSDTGNMSIVDSGKRIGKQVIYNLSGWKNGFSTATVVTDTYKVSGYIVKYITKDLCSVSEGKRRFYHSNNLELPQKKIFDVPRDKIDEFIKILSESLGATVTWRSDVGGYLDTSYIHLQNRKEEKKDGAEN